MVVRGDRDHLTCSVSWFERGDVGGDRFDHRFHRGVVGVHGEARQSRICWGAFGEHRPQADHGVLPRQKWTALVMPDPQGRAFGFYSQPDDGMAIEGVRDRLGHRGASPETENPRCLQELDRDLTLQRPEVRFPVGVEDLSDGSPFSLLQDEVDIKML